MRRIFIKQNKTKIVKVKARETANGNNYHVEVATLLCMHNIK